MNHFFREARRRRVFRVAALYVIGAWVVMQAADVFFPAWGIPDSAIRVLVFAAFLGFPVALVFGWIFDIRPDGIHRTQPVGADGDWQPRPLQRADYLLLVAFAVVAGAILFNAVSGVLQTSGDIRPAPGQPPLSVEAPDESIAVLAFANMSSDPENEYFADGLSEEILNRLGEFRDLHVIARTSSFAFKDSDFDIPKIAATLKVSYLLQGSVRKHGDTLRITAQLVDKTGRQLWTDTFDRTLEAIFDLQREIATLVAKTVAPQISNAIAATDYQPDIDAYQHYLIGREILHSQVANYDNLAAAEFRKAIAIDPHYAEAHAELASALSYARDREWHLRKQATREQKHAEAEAAIDRALELQPDLARAHAAKGFLHYRRDEVEDARSALRKALSIDPNMVDVAAFLIGLIAESPEDWWALVQETARLDPLYPPLNFMLGWGYAGRGDFVGARRTFERLLSAPRPAQWSFSHADRFFAGRGQLAKAVEISQRLVLDTVSTGRRAFGLNHLAAAYARLGMSDSAEQWESRLASPNRFTGFRLELEGRYQEILDRWDHLAEQEGVTVADLNPVFARYYGNIQALAGFPNEAITTLESVIELGTPAGDIWGDPRVTLVYAYQQTGQEARALPFLDRMGDEWGWRRENGLLNFGPELAEYALFRLLAGDPEDAVGQLQKAVDAGWRGYYEIIHDPRWDPLRSDSRFQALLETIKADVDAQRTEMERIDRERNFEERVYLILAAAEE